MRSKANHKHRRTNAPTNKDDCLSQNEYEAHVEKHLVEPVRWFFQNFARIASRQFIFRCFSVAPISSSLLRHFAQNESPVGYLIHQPWSYVLAHSRTVREMALQNDLTLDESAPTKCELKCSEERFGYWLDRFESWRRAIDRTFWLYLERKGAISKYRDPKEREAARMGTIHRLWVDALPAPLLGFFAAELRKRSARDSEIFHKHAASVQKVRWDFPELDLWLIEVWPLVVGHNWTYEDTWRIACEKFHPSMEELKGKKKALDTAEAFSNHCKMKSLNLRLSPEAQKRGGRPKGGISTQSKLALGAELALEIDGFQWPGENKTSEKLRCVRLSLEGLITVDQVDPTLTG